MASKATSSFSESREDGMGLYMATKISLLTRITESLEKIVKLIEEEREREVLEKKGVLRNRT